MNFSFGGPNSIGLKTKRSHFGIKQMILLMFFGLIFTGFGIFFIKESQIDENWLRVDGKVTSFSTSHSGSDNRPTYSAIVSYEVDNQEYTKTSSVSSSSTPQIGSTREIAYNPNFPDEAKVVEGAGLSVFLYFFTFFGLLLFITSPFYYLKSRKRSQIINSLVQSGQKIQGVLVDIQKANNDNRNNTYRIIVSATNLSGAVQNYTSDPLTGIGGLAMADFRTNPIPIDVYLDPTNPENYYVDISDIPNLTPERIADLVKSAALKNQPNTIVPNVTPQATPVTQNNGLTPQVPPIVNSMPSQEQPITPETPNNTPPNPLS